MVNKRRRRFLLIEKRWNSSLPTSVLATTSAFRACICTVTGEYCYGAVLSYHPMFREAIEHFLSALRIQRSPETSLIWSTLRSAVIRLNMPFDGQSALMEAVDSRDTARLSAALLNHGM